MDGSDKEKPTDYEFVGYMPAKLAHSLNEDTVEKITSSTTAELGRVIWAMLFVYHNLQQAEKYIIHCDPEFPPAL